ncbi:MAG TPA: lipocalin-like domain-containing protein [Ramlibacter sp.]|nr:lipocalin-like domain-containing protein [Ramlibacter sp.]
MAQHPIVGTWRLVGYWSEYSDQPRIHPLGTDARGYILYTADGFMSGTMQRARPRPFAIADRLQGTADEKVAAFDDYVTYCGRWRADGGDLIHDIELSLLPNWIGQSQRRFAQWHNPDRVDLVGTWDLGGGRRRSTLVEWERAKP